jgi:hypothetical protein
MDATVRFPSVVRFRAPAGLHAAIALAARRRMTTTSELIRQLLIRELQRDGVPIDDETVTGEMSTNL